MPRTWRLVDSGLVSPFESTALDEAILETHIEGKIPNTLHFYRRAVPTISLGYFQKVSETVNQAECELRGVSIVRRKSGGSSIYTDAGQLIYGLVVHESDLPAERPASFRIICTALANAVRSFGIDAVYRPLNDVEVDGRKISGNAQLRRKGTVLQHGTIVVDTDLSQMDAVLKVDCSKNERTLKPSERMTTLASLLGNVPDMELVKGSIMFELGAVFGVDFALSSLTDGERELARKLVGDHYSRPEWNFKF